MKTRYEEKRRLIEKGIGFWTKTKKHGWCVRIAGNFHAGDVVTVMGNAGRTKQVTLGDSIPNSVFLWKTTSGESVPGQLFKLAMGGWKDRVR